MGGSAMEILDGLEALRAVLSLREVMSMTERTARWVDPKTFDREGNPLGVVPISPTIENAAEKRLQQIKILNTREHTIPGRK